MAKLTFYLDTRSGKEDHPLKIRIQHKDKSAYVGLCIRLRPEQWNGKEIVGTATAGSDNEYIRNRMTLANAVCLKLSLSGKIDKMSATELKEIIENNGEEQKEGTLFEEYFKECIGKKRKESTRISVCSKVNFPHFRFEKGTT